MFEKRVYNFSAGPSMLPESVLLIAQKELLNYNGSGMSVMEMSHRSKVYDEIINKTEELMRKVLNIPQNYKVLFLQGGASLQFASVPINLMTKNNKADYIITGQFSQKAYKEAKKYGSVNIAASTEADNFSRIPDASELRLSEDADYVHLCTNNTIFGTKWSYVPDTGNVPLVADMSSSILSEEIDVSKYGLIYAGAQKNMAPAGLTVVIIREDLIGNARDYVPTVIDYAVQAKNNSMYNTPSTYAIYMCKLVLEWILSLGGLKELNRINREKAALLYNCIDDSKMFSNPVKRSDRSIMNVTFKSVSDETDALFVKLAASEGLLTLKGHRSVGGMRASIYNAMPTEGVESLVRFIRDFEKNNS